MKAIRPSRSEVALGVKWWLVRVCAKSEMGEALTHATYSGQCHSCHVTGIVLHARRGRSPACSWEWESASCCGCFSRGVAQVSGRMRSRWPARWCTGFLSLRLTTEGSKAADGGTPALEPIAVDSSRRRVLRYLTLAATFRARWCAIYAASRPDPRRCPAYRVLERI